MTYCYKLVVSRDGGVDAPAISLISSSKGLCAMTDKIILPRNSKSIPDWDGYYITAIGDVFSEKWGKIKKLKPDVSAKGYMRVTFSQSNKTKRFLVHRLVATLFIPNPENKKTVNHKDGNPSNNNVKNLEWATHSENHIHAFKALGKKANLNQKGKFNEKSALSKVVFQYDKNGQFIKSYPSVNEAQRQNPRIDAKNISSACLGKIKSCGGYIWKYQN